MDTSKFFLIILLIYYFNFVSDKNNPSRQNAYLSNNLKDKIAKLNDVEKNIIEALSNSGKVLEELSKDKLIMKQCDPVIQGFSKSIREIDQEIQSQLSYINRISMGYPHDGSTYGSKIELALQVSFLKLIKTIIFLVLQPQHHSGGWKSSFHRTYMNKRTHIH